MDFFSNYLEKFGSNFIVSAMVPSMALVITSVIVFDPILNLSSYFEDTSGIYQLVGFSLMLVIPTIIIGYTLTALNTYVLKLFEGYVFLHRFSFMRKAQQKKAARLLKRQDTLRKRIEIVNNCDSTNDRIENLLEKLHRQHYLITAEYDHSFPPNPNDILPTKFGNILKAAENYSGTRYGMDGVEFWPRLIHVIPSQYQKSIEGSRNELSFLVNMAILAIAFFFLCLGAIFYSFVGPTFSSTTTTLEFVGFGNALRYLIAGLLALFVNWFFNRASLYSVGSFGIMIRSAYDLFRFDLMEQLRVKVPNDSVTEFDEWYNLNQLIVLGKDSLEFTPLKYHTKKK